MDFPNRKMEASLAALPTELADSIYESLPASTLAKVALTSKALYAAVQGPLYRKPVLLSFYKLQLFTRTLNGAAHWTKWGAPSSKNVLRLKIIVDPAEVEQRTGNKLTAVILARFCGTCARYCPKVEMQLSVVNVCCFEQPFVSFGGEIFPRVTSLYLRLGYAPTQNTSPTSPRSESLSQVIPSRRFMSHQARQERMASCQPNSKFWINVFNGNSFPDLQEVHFNHTQGNARQRYDYGGFERSHVSFNSGDLGGLANVRKIIIDSCPELNDLVIQNGLAGAPVLTSLALINCHLTYEALATLLPHALPNLSEFKLQVPFESRFAGQVREMLAHSTGFEPNQVPHLCPLIRKFSKNIKRLSLALPYLCRDMFLDDAENAALVKVGVPGNATGGRYGEAREGELDTILLEKTLKDFRRKVEENLATEAVKSNKPKKGQNGISGSSGNGKEHDNYEADLLARERRNMIQKEGWKRKILLMRRHCRQGDLWVELEYLATLEEPGIKWILGNNRLNEAGRFENGVLAKQLDLATEFKDELSHFNTKEQLNALRRRGGPNYGVDMNDYQDGLQHPAHGHPGALGAAGMGGGGMFPPGPNPLAAPFDGGEDEEDDDVDDDDDEEEGAHDEYEW